jgi:hypothetical protein
MNGMLHLVYVNVECGEGVDGGVDRGVDGGVSAGGVNVGGEGGGGVDGGDKRAMARAESARDKCICCNKPFSIRGVMSKHTLYAKLPKENIYVPVESWYHEYMKSQMLELLYILRHLGAHNVHLKLERRIDETSVVEASGSLGNMVPNLAVDVGIKHNKVKHGDNLIDLEATYDTEGFEPYTSMEDFSKDLNIFYLSQSQDWQDIIIQRLSCQVMQLKFTFNITDSVKVDNEFYGKLQKMGVAIANGSSLTGTLTVTGNVSFMGAAAS